MPASPQIMGIVNLTPDSFSDGGRLHDVEAALAHMESLLEAGAHVLDLGAESTRPGAQTLSDAEEWQRLGPVLEAARTRFPQAVLSIDTYHPATAQRALDVGANWINDVSGAANPQMAEIIAKHPHCHYVFMHALSVPADPAQTLPETCDPVMEIAEWCKQRILRLQEAGVDTKQLIADLGIGFGKTAAQSIELLRRAGEMVTACPVPLLIGHSRKSFLAEAGARHASDRDVETHVISAHLAGVGVAYLRVHDVAGTRKALAAQQLLMD